jgi:hypothetical protein
MRETEFKLFLKECAKGAIGLAMFIAEVVLSGIADEAAGNWITGHMVSKCFFNALICFTTVITMKLMGARYITVACTNIAILTMVSAVMTSAKSFMLPIAMELAMVVVYSRRKNTDHNPS